MEFNMVDYSKVIAFCILMIITLTFAQAPDTLWTRTYGGAANDMGYDVEKTSDGGYVITGWTRSYGSGGSDVYLIKTDADGYAQWEKTAMLPI
jgi:hypothetical protein